MFNQSPKLRTKPSAFRYNFLSTGYFSNRFLDDESEVRFQNTYLVIIEKKKSIFKINNLNKN